MKRVLVSGGAGYIGSCVVELLVKKGYHPVVFDSLIWGTDGFEGLPDNSYTLVEGDIRNSRDVAYALEGIDGGVIHLAGIVGEPACKKNRVAHITTNILSTNTLIDCMTDKEMDFVRDLIYCSSCSVYGNVHGMYEEVVETTPTMPLSDYANGKLRAEEIILRRAAESPLFSPTILRLTTVFGWSPRLRLDLVTNMFALKALRNEPITIHGDGGQHRSLIHVRDVASSLVRALETPRHLREGQIFHVGDESNNITLRDLAEKVKNIVPETRIEYANSANTDRRDYKINCQKIRNALDWSAKYSVDYGLEEMVTNLRGHNWDYDDPKYRNNTYDYH